MLQQIKRRGPFPPPRWIQIVVSGLIAGLGLFAPHVLETIDQDLRRLYAEYTLAATNLAHASSDLLRYRVTILRAIEAPSQREFERITASLPGQRAHMQQAVNDYTAARRRVQGPGQQHDPQLDALRRSLDAYFGTADYAVAIMVRLWQTTSPSESAELRHQAELQVADHSAAKLVAAIEDLERLLNNVTEVGRRMRDESSDVIRTTSLILVLGSLVIAAINLLP